ncbi:hypothetical protein N7471_009295 [Penicillium samsonianum]|uniref:uncharacterized protein n=1 Tax=Penicillium samsonianum TaxID=1882272 RepID=UPI0025480AA5|nr:uncharacterized protein N7471_009295 [Penicillium samsonianum]KAJ6128078.1 hypothetical protein N7471_009295 [Penicillium samsonianum]
MQRVSILRKETTGGTLEENPRPMVTTRVEADATVSMMPSSERISSMLLICNDCRIVGGQSEVGLVLPFGPKVYLFKWEAHSRFGLFTFWCRMFHNLNLLCREGPFMSTHLPLFDEDPAALMYFGVHSGREHDLILYAALGQSGCVAMYTYDNDEYGFGMCVEYMKEIDVRLSCSGDKSHVTFPSSLPSIMVSRVAA